SQNVVSQGASESAAVHLIVTANYDAGRAGLMYRDRIRRALAQARGVVGGWTPGWLGWLAIAMVWLIAMAILRLEGHRGTVVGVAQLIPTVGLVLGLALLLEQASARFTSRANDNVTGVAAAIALVKALDAAAPRHL